LVSAASSPPPPQAARPSEARTATVRAIFFI
jgi:hypothetical protein